MKVVHQDGNKDCGICCLLSIIRFYGGDVSKEYLRELTNTTKDGVSFYNLIEAAKIIGFDAIGVTGTINNINVDNLPCIVHFIVNKKYKHFVVLYKIDKKNNQVSLMDPSKGKKIISISEFNLLTSNNYIFLKPIRKLPIMKKKRIIYNNIKTLLHNNKNMFYLILFLTTFYFVLSILTSFHFKYLSTYCINNNISHEVVKISTIIFILYILKNINLVIRNIILNKWNSLFDYETTSNTYKQILLLPYIYYKNRTTGEVVSRFRDLNIIRNYISNFLCIMQTDLISIIIFFIIMLKISIRITTIIIIIFIIQIIITLIIKKKVKKQINSIKRNEDIINSYIIQGISNVDTIKGSHLEKRLIDKFNIQYKKYLETFYHYNLIQEIYSFIKNNINDLIKTIIYTIGTILVIKNKMILPNLILYQSLFLYFNSSFYNLLYIIEEYNSYKISKERIEELFMINKENFNNNYFYLSYTLDGTIQIKDLTYKVGSKTILNNINLNISSKDKVLLLGKSGSGKTTLMKILLRYISVDYNKVKINNIDINHYHLENIRNYITYVTNNEYLFSDTIKNNITLYKEIDDEYFTKVVESCLVDDILNNKNLNYDSLIEENGFNLSNGEKQRIILARSILKNSNIYIFDEALGSIDVNTEKKILNNIFELLKDKTIIIISHRFNNKKLFNRVLSIENGVIVEK